MNQSDRDQVADLLLTDPESGKPCVIVSTLRTAPGGFMSFDVQSGPDAPKWAITVRIKESGGQDANPAGSVFPAFTPANADVARQAGTFTASDESEATP